MRKRLITFLIIFLIILVGIIAFFFMRSQRTVPTPTGLPTSGASYKSLTPGVSSKEDAIKLLGTPLNSPSSDTLDFKSNNPNLPNQVVTSNNKISLIKEIVTVSDRKTTTDITSQYGTAPNVLYGPASTNGFNLYVYPDKGIAYLGHVKEPIVLEIWYFQLTTLKNFISEWAPNYSETPHPIQ